LGHIASGLLWQNTFKVYSWFLHRFTLSFGLFFRLFRLDRPRKVCVIIANQLFIRVFRDLFKLSRGLFWAKIVIRASVTGNFNVNILCYFHV
jgi:hypothetical protein